MLTLGRKVPPWNVNTESDDIPVLENTRKSSITLFTSTFHTYMMAHSNKWLNILYNRLVLDFYIKVAIRTKTTV